MTQARDVMDDLLVFSDDWHGLPTSCRHIIKRLLPSYRVTWFDTIGLRSPKLNAYDVLRSIQKLRGWLRPASGSSGKDEGLTVVNPLQVPYNRYSLVRGLNAALLKRAVAKNGSGGGRRVSLTTWPFLGTVIGRLGEDFSVYYRVDDFAEFPDVNREFIRATENSLMRQVDMVVASARNLVETAHGARDVRYLPHGVDFGHFAAAAGGSGTHARLSHIPRPHIGFFGVINTWVDMDLMREVALRHPQWSFVFIGPSQLPAASLPQAGNIHYLGPAAYEELPSLAASFDVATIPFRINTLTAAVNPVKLLEYFAMGLPVVATPLPELGAYREVVHLAAGSEAFGQALEKALEPDGGEGREARMAISRSNSWESRAATLSGWIREEVGKRSQ